MPSISSKLLNVFTRNVIKPRLFDARPVEDLCRYAARVDRLFAPAPRGVRIEPAPQVACDADWISPSDFRGDRVILYFPGGAFVIRTPRAHRAMVARIVCAAHARALLVFYRLSPQHPFPCALQDALGAYEGLLAAGVPASRIILGGDSSGGNLALATLLALRDAKATLPAGAFAISPVTDLLNHERGSRRSNELLDPLLPGPGSRGLDTRALYVGGNRKLLTHPYVSPIHGDFRRLPPLLLQVGSTEVLLDDSTLLVEKARAAGVDAEVEVWDEVPHVWHGMPMPESGRAIDHLADFVRRCCP